MVSHQCKDETWVFPFRQDKASFRKAVLEWAAGCATVITAAGEGSCLLGLQGETVSSLREEDHPYCFMETLSCPVPCWKALQLVSPHAAWQASRVMAFLGKRKSSLCLQHTQNFSITFLKPGTWYKCVTCMPFTVTEGAHFNGKPSEELTKKSSESLKQTADSCSLTWARTVWLSPCGSEQEHWGSQGRWKVGNAGAEAICIRATRPLHCQPQ